MLTRFSFSAQRAASEVHTCFTKKGLREKHTAETQVQVTSGVQVLIRWLQINVNLCIVEPTHFSLQNTKTRGLQEEMAHSVKIFL